MKVSLFVHCFILLQPFFHLFVPLYYRSLLLLSKGLRFAEAKLQELDGQKKASFAQALDQLKKDKSSIYSNFDLCGLLEDNEQYIVDDDDDDDEEDDADDDDDDDYIDIGDGKNKSSSSSSSSNIHQKGNKRGKLNSTTTTTTTTATTTRKRQYYHSQSYAPLTDEQVDNFQVIPHHTT